MKINHIDDVIPFSKKYAGRTIREIIRADSGYLKDLFLKNKRLCFSPECFQEICRLTKEHKDNWEVPTKPGLSAFAKTKTYGVPYLYNFNDQRLLKLNNERIGYESV